MERDKMSEEVHKNTNHSKAYFYIGAIAVSCLMIWFGTSMTNKIETNPLQEESSEPEANTIPKSSNSGDAETDIKRAIMVDTVAKWQDVDEFSLHIDENTNTKYQGDYVVNITANYNGTSSNIGDTLTVYCNKIATAIDLTSHPVAELTLSWKIPDMPDEYNGMCHYHSENGVLIYDDESNGILTVK